MIYGNLVQKLINYMFGKEHGIIVTEVWSPAPTNQAKKPEVCVYVYLDRASQRQIANDKRNLVMTILNLLRIKSYLKNHHANLKVENLDA